MTKTDCIHFTIALPRLIAERLAQEARGADVSRTVYIARILTRAVSPYAKIERLGDRLILKCAGSGDLVPGLSVGIEGDEVKAHHELRRLAANAGWLIWQDDFSDPAPFEAK